MASNLTCETGYYRSACVECQRRKQKCNREWPCDSCRRRKVPDGCRYNEATTTSVDAPDACPENSVKFPSNAGDRSSLNVTEGQVFEALAERAFVNLGIDETPRENAPPEQKQDMVNLGSSNQFDRLIELLPPRRLMDDLVQLFINDINYHYYIIYSPVFLQDYHIWWDRRAHGDPVSLQYTCLLAMLCSGTIQHLAGDLEKAVVEQYGEFIHLVSDKMHTAVRELSGIIPVGHYHMMNVQRLLHSCYWYKAEARFVEAWHVLNQAILEAKELELHIEPKPNAVSDFDREMRRRLWCILDTWDWQISSGLSRPKLIDRGGCTAELPELTLEGYNPSPMEHMKMQSQLTRELASRFGAPKNVISAKEVEEYKQIILNWVRRFPKIYDFYDPDMSRDSIHPWIFPHRFYLYTMACLLILNPIRHYMVKSYNKDSPADELQCRADGLFFSLILLKTQRKWVGKINGRDGRLHFIIFSIFDTAAILCTALVKDTANTIENKGDVLHAIAESTAMLKALINISETAKMSHDILYRLTRKLKKPNVAKELGDSGRKRTKVAAAPCPQPASSAPPASGNSTAPGVTCHTGPSTAPSTVRKSDKPSSSVNLHANAPARGADVGSQVHVVKSVPTKVHAPPQPPQPRQPRQPRLVGYANAPPVAPRMVTQPGSLSATGTRGLPLDQMMPQYGSQNSVSHMQPPMMQNMQPSHQQQPHQQPRQQPSHQQQPQQQPRQQPSHQQQPHQQQPHQQVGHMSIGALHPDFYQPLQPAASSSIDTNALGMTHVGSRGGPTGQPVGFPQPQPPQFGNGIFNMNVADGVPAIANYWDAPVAPMSPMTSYSIMGHNVPVNVVPEPRELLMGQQQEHLVPDLNLTNLTEAEIGSLAPLWSWHSSNLFPDDGNNGSAA